jgi:hypothetical protein
MAINNGEAFKKFLNQQPLNLVMFGWVEGLRAQGINITVEKAILNFMDKNGLTDDDMNVEAARKRYYRMQEDLREAIKAA